MSWLAQPVGSIASITNWMKHPAHARMILNYPDELPDRPGPPVTRRQNDRRNDMTVPERMKFGVFMAPFHRVGENPTLALERDLELLQWLDVLGFD